MSKRIIKILCSVVALTLMAAMLGSCELFGGSEQTEQTTGEETLPYAVTTGEETTQSGDVTASSENTSTAETTVLSPEVTTEPQATETTSEPEPVVMYEDPLTGLETEADLRRVIPISVVLDNLSIAAPQTGISRADILIEMPVEGGITRLLMITNKYGGDEVYGPVRSTRHYTVSLSQAFGTLMVGAGGSPLGYSMIQSLGLPYVDGVNDRYSGLGFYRDSDRVASSGATHALMTTGERILQLASRHGWSTVASQNVRSAFNFADESDTLVGKGEGAATHVCIPYSSSQYVQMIYSKSAGTYYRYQLGDRAHIDAENGEQLNFKNVFILFAETESIPDDTEGRLDMVTTGEGTGYYISDGKYISIKWSRIGDTSSFVFTDDSGKVISVNRGKTFISVAPKWIEDQVELNYKA